ncbi:carbohydrate kinase [Chitinophaga parva]|uniref:Carbohydrate kinase n=1 Tax=Chitinophaga parva TaxID=2169414 RepID=A0A2T7BD86_9BACT|nr:sugar kinase [Chitinophaga parva]PUZ23058.1 carbohydrate kinase [Chitinophaga parva]
MSKKKILCFGELLLRICPDLSGQWLHTHQLPFFVGGAEANVATALARWGLQPAYLSALPDNALSASLLQYLQEQGIDTTPVILREGRLGLYYLPKGNDLQHTGVIYDRAHSSFAQLQPAEINWEQILEDVSWFHFSAITPALNASLAAICEAAVLAAADLGIPMSVDLNYRARLWQYKMTPHQVMPSLVKHCTLVMGNVWAAEKMLGIPVDALRPEGNTQADYLAQATRSSQALMAAFPKVKAVANTFRFDQPGGGILYYAALNTRTEAIVSRTYKAASILDKVGSGDCFMAGLLYGHTQGHNWPQTLEFAAAAAFNKLFIESDATTSSVDTIHQTILSNEQ